MAYPPPQGPYPPYGGPSQPYSPQSGYQGAPPAQYPPRGHSPYPQQQGYGPPPPQGQYAAPGYPPQQGAYSQPQPQGYPPQGYPPQAPQQQQYGQPVPGQYLSQQTYGEYGAPHPGPPPSAAYGASQQLYGVPQTIPTPPSAGYIPGQMAQGDATVEADAHALRQALKGHGTDEKTVVRVLAHQTALQIPLLKQTYSQRHRCSLEADVSNDTSSYFRMCLLSILRGPLQQDVYLLHKALDRIGTNEVLLNDVLLARSNADMLAIKQAYHATYHGTLEDAVRGDLSGKTERFFSMVLNATRQEDSAPVLPHQVDADVSELHRATEGRLGTDQLAVCAVISNRSDGALRAIALAYEAKYRIPLEKVLQKEFSGHMQQALVQMVRAGADRAMRDAGNLEDAMKGLGTKDELLVTRVVRAHWDRAHLGQVVGAYKARFGKELVGRVRGETSGSYRECLVAMVDLKGGM
ncbi:MAG: hypothetical protein FRX48_04954 [Lasallia pustulata]|uniref:Annexin n=1 Tax=Lasallia pustulata TaxID=136370 RepID=A0A5M8PSK6_9LECA|nr:MAG: hypothetical protein FRX48_04954 [Lasallia pustulata]